MGKLMFALAACWLLLTLSTALEQMLLLWSGLALFYATTLVGVIYANTA